MRYSELKRFFRVRYSLIEWEEPLIGLSISPCRTALNMHMNKIFRKLVTYLWQIDGNGKKRSIFIAILKGSHEQNAYAVCLADAEDERLGTEEKSGSMRRVMADG